MKAQAWLRVLATTVVPAVGGFALLILAIAWLAGLFVEKIEPVAGAVESRRVLTSDESQRLDEVYELEKPYFAEAVGTLRAATRTDIAARILAPIEEILVNAGDRVERGDVLIRLDRRDAESRREQAQSVLESARFESEQATSDHARNTELLEKNALSTREYEQGRTALNVAQARVRQAEQAVNEAEVILSYTTIQATQDGVIVDRMAEPGDLAQPGSPLLVLYDPTSLRLEVPVMENLAVQLQRGDPVTVRIDALERDVEAVVDEIVPQAEAASRSFLVKVALAPGEGLYEGMFGRLRIPSGVRRHLCLATAAIQTIGQLQFVDVVRPDGKTLERRFITTGRLGMPERVEVLSGVEAGDRVLLHRAVTAEGDTEVP